MLEEPCITDYFGCTDHLGCGELPVPPWGEGPRCVLEMFRDIGSRPGASVELDFERGGSPDWTWTEQTYLLQLDRTVIHQNLVHDDELGSDFMTAMRRCELRAPEYFQACLDVPSGDCAEPVNWMTNCVEIEELECPAP